MQDRGSALQSFTGPLTHCSGSPNSHPKGSGRATRAAAALSAETLMLQLMFYSMGSRLTSPDCGAEELSSKSFDPKPAEKPGPYHPAPAPDLALKLSWLNEGKSLQAGSNILWKSLPRRGEAADKFLWFCNEMLNRMSVMFGGRCLIPSCGEFAGFPLSDV